MNTSEFPIWARIAITGLIVIMGGFISGMFSEYHYGPIKKWSARAAWVLISLGLASFGVGVLTGVWS